jgi:hypothetical protein
MIRLTVDRVCVDHALLEVRQQAGSTENGSPKNRATMAAVSLVRRRSLAKMAAIGWDPSRCAAC